MSIVAVTGGTGFIGRHLIARHVADGDQVRYLTRRKELEPIRGANPFLGSLGSTPGKLRKFAGGADVLYHCAAELSNEAEMEKTNVLGTANLIAAATGEIGRWVQLSSTGIYGSPRYGDIQEDSEKKPFNEYERTKAKSDMLACEAAEKRDFSCILVRPSNVYGADMPNRSLFQLIQMIDRGMFFFIGKHGAIANYVHVENVIDAMVLCGTATLPVNGRAYIISDHLTLEDFIEVIATSLGKKAPRKRLPESFVRMVLALIGSVPQFPLTRSRVDALTNRVIYRTDRIQSELGYSNRISVDEGIARLTNHWKNGQG